MRKNGSDRSIDRLIRHERMDGFTYKGGTSKKTKRMIVAFRTGHTKHSDHAWSMAVIHSTFIHPFIHRHIPVTCKSLPYILPDSMTVYGLWKEGRLASTIQNNCQTDLSVRTDNDRNRFCFCFGFCFPHEPFHSSEWFPWKSWSKHQIQTKRNEMKWNETNPQSTFL